MSSAPFMKFTEDLETAAARIRSLSARRITIVHHNDTDGITAGAILKTGLRRAGFETENIPIERVHPLFLPRIHIPERHVFLYADLGSQSLPLIADAMRAGTHVFVLDHHLPIFPHGFRLPENLLLVNPELRGIDGDTAMSGAAVAFFWARALDGGNSDLAHLAVLGAFGDQQLVRGNFEGPNRAAYDIACAQGEIHSDSGTAAEAVFPFFGATGNAVSRMIVDIAVNGYHEGGALFALDFCLGGRIPSIDRFADRVRRIGAERFQAEMERLNEKGLERHGNIQWIDAANRLHPMGLKAIGLLCQEIAGSRHADPEKYLAGFQDFPSEIPLIGSFGGEETKVSFRVTPRLREAVERGEKPHLAEIVPPAAQAAGGLAEGCHRFAAACTVPSGNRIRLIHALDREVNRFSGRAP
jgi:hypothetical protein